MKVIETAIPGVLILEPKVFGDERGYFLESWYKRDFEAAIGREIQTQLRKHNAEGKNPAAIAELMSKLKIGAQMLVNDGDETTAKLMYDGCSMGIEKLSEYVNMYPAADKAAKNAAEKLIRLEQCLADELRAYL